ncbi:MAG: hypothetical protein EZS28_011197 [Streblomastix strix]|uniref:Uncharacterized protein n=1 Tax=Streblomastix strix TaxID=222440 RepID=A0A5J4WFT9_9EUKA|nr:MAG: hypothetical protein EZS28_011197 [Streblomastix strix]
MIEEERNNFDYRNPNAYLMPNINKHITNTMSDGVPNNGKGLLIQRDAILKGVRGCIFGCNGCQRLYVGERAMCVLCCLTCGGCWIGQLYDLCTIHQKVAELNSDIRRVAHKCYDQHIVDMQLHGYGMPGQGFDQGFNRPISPYVGV